MVNYYGSLEDLRSSASMSSRSMSSTRFNKLLEDIKANNIGKISLYKNDGLTNEQLQTLFLALKNNTSLKAFELFNKTVNDKIIYFAKGLNNHQNLEDVKIQNQRLNSVSIKAIVSMINSCNLQKLQIYNCHIDEEAFIILTDALAKNTSLTSLALHIYNYSTYTSLGSQKLKSALKANKFIKTLEIRSMGDNCAADIASILKSENSWTSLKLNSFNTGLAEILEALKFNTSLKELHLDNLYDFPESERLAELLRCNNTLQKIDFSANGDRDKIVEIIAPALKDNFSLTEIVFCPRPSNIDLITPYLKRNQELALVTKPLLKAMEYRASNKGEKLDENELKLLLKHKGIVYEYMDLDALNIDELYKEIESIFYEEINKLESAIIAGNSKEVLSLLQSGVSLYDSPHKSLILSAVEGGDLSVIEAFSQAGVDFNKKDKYGSSFVHYAAMYGKDDVLKAVCKHGASLYLQDNSDSNLFHIATANGRISIIKVFLELGGYINTKSSKGWTALHIAAYFNKCDIMQVLIEEGASLNITDNDGNTPLMRAIISGSSDAVEMLLSYGADVNVINFDDFNALLLSVVGKDYIKTLLEHGAHIHIKGVHQNRAVTIEKLLNYIPEIVKFTPKDNIIDYLIFFALQNSYGFKRIVSLLLDNGLDVNITDKSNVSILQIGLKSTLFLQSKLTFVTELIVRGADLNAKGSLGDTPLELVLKDRNLDVDDKNRELIQLIFLEGGRLGDNSSAFIKPECLHKLLLLSKFMLNLRKLQDENKKQNPSLDEVTYLKKEIGSLALKAYDTENKDICIIILKACVTHQCFVPPKLQVAFKKLLQKKLYNICLNLKWMKKSFHEVKKFEDKETNTQHLLTKSKLAKEKHDFYNGELEALKKLAFYLEDEALKTNITRAIDYNDKLFQHTTSFFDDNLHELETNIIAMGEDSYNY